MLTLLVSLCLCNPPSREEMLLRTWRAVCAVESGGDSAAIGDGGRAVGIGQLHAAYVDEANRIIGRKKWSYVDRLDPERSWQMFRIVSLYHHPNGTPEIWARCHVAGPDGDRQACSLGYWRKVRATIEAQ